jgi:hypothetical protein
MDLLSLIGMATKRRGDYFTQAEALLKKVDTQPELEEKMKKEAEVLVKGLRDKQIRWEEYERTLLDKTVISALTAVGLGASGSNPRGKMERAWPSIVGDLLPPLNDFLDETKQSLQNGEIVIGDKTEDFAEVTSWFGLLGRVIRYIANPSYSFFNLGEYYVRRDQGFREMRRVPRLDGRTCPDCISYGHMGWLPIGTLPMPGRECQCYDRCRCSIEYR